MNTMKGLLSFIFLTTLSCTLGYFVQIFLQSTELQSQVVEGLRYAADRLEASVSNLNVSSSSLSKRSTFDIHYPRYSPTKSLQNRRNKYLKICDRYSDPMRPESSPKEPKIEALQVFYSHGLVFCTPKNSGANRKIDTMTVQSMMENHFDVAAFKKMFPKSFSIVPNHGIVVRHPMERLVSVYRAEFEESIDAGNGKQIPAEITFPGFIDLVVRGPELLQEYMRKMRSKGESAAVNVGLIDGKGLSSHWASYWSQCGLCNPLFDPKYIVHLETLNEDFEIINTEVMNNNEKMKSLLKIKEQPHQQLNIPSSNPEILQLYYSQLSKKTIQDIYDKYKADHELFGYTPDYFLQFGN